MDDDLTILHIEDDQLLAEIVKTAFKNFGFRGDMISARSVSEALRLLVQQARDGKSVNLMISDMRLPDGSGLDLIREVKTDPVYRSIPIIVLSHDLNRRVINDAYALGASSYFAKGGSGSGLFVSLRNIYSHWIEDAALPRHSGQDRLQDVLERAISLRTRTAEFYLRLAQLHQEPPEELEFWLDRTLCEGNIANLLAFFRNMLHEQDVAPETIERLAGMQSRVRDALQSAEEKLPSGRAPSADLAYRLTLDLTDALDEDAFSEVLGILFPVSSVATTALKARAAAQIKGLASHIRARTGDGMLLRKTDALLAWARRMGSDDARND